MKNILLSLMLFTICSVKAQNQNLTNGGFESWTDVNVYQLLDNWFTFNQYAVWGSSTTPVAKVTDAHSGNFAAKISSFVMFSGSGNPIDTIQGGILYGDFDIAGGGSPGVPFQSRPDSIVGYYKSNLLSGDSAMIQVLLGNSPSTSTNQTGFCFGYITQNASTYTRFSFPIIYDPAITIAPDTLFLAIGLGSQNFNLASTITVDDIQFVYNVTGVDEIAQATFNVFPNPANNLLIIESTIEDNISIYNAVGQIVQTVQIIPAVKAEVNCSQLEVGIYFLKGKNGYSEKLVVKH
jgi:hypothetical protein